MSQPDQQQPIDPLENLPLSPETDCPYLPDRLSAMRYVFTDVDLPTDLIDLLLEKGFRRCGDMWYLNDCPACRACIPYRVPVDGFKPSRNMKRVLRRNAAVTISVGDPELSPEKIELYLNYQHDQHFVRPPFPEAKKEEFDPTDAVATMSYQMYENPSSSRELTMTVDGRLVGFGTIDVGETAVSLVYFVFDPDHGERSLGTLNILKSLQWAKENGYSKAYLGLYIDGQQKMAYKSRFQPAEIMGADRRWAPFGGDQSKGPAQGAASPTGPLRG